MDLEDKEISRDDLLEWLDYKVTKAFISAINIRIKELYLEVGNGRTLDLSNANWTLGETAKTVGKIEGLQEVLDIDIVKE